MAQIVEKTNSTSIDAPRKGDEQLIGPVYVQSWIDAYLNKDMGLTEEILKDMIGFVDTEDGVRYREEVFSDALNAPDKVLYKVVRREGEIVGFLHATKEEAYNNLESMYLLNKAKGQGTGKRLMEEFINWSNKDLPCKLRVFSSNTIGIKFYEKFGFKKGDRAPEAYKNNLEFIEMVRPVQIV